MKIGYARVSTGEQTLDLQADALDGAECARIFRDVASGTAADRPGLAEALSHLRAGDVLVVWRLDRLGRSVPHLVELMADLDARGVNFCSLTESIDTSTPMGRFFFHVMGALAQMERDIIAQRTKAGLKAARARGRKGGAPRKLTSQKLESARRLLAGGMPVSQVADTLGVHRATLYRRLRASERAKDRGNR